jgi:hypothetical protein
MHWPEKVKVTESSKSTVKDKMKSPRKLPKCSSCGMNGHNMSGCQWPPPMKRKRKNDLIEFDIDEMTKLDEIRVDKRGIHKNIDMSVDWV